MWYRLQLGKPTTMENHVAENRYGAKVTGKVVEWRIGNGSGIQFNSVDHGFDEGGDHGGFRRFAAEMGKQLKAAPKL